MTTIGLEYMKHKDNLEIAKRNARSQAIQADAAKSQANTRVRELGEKVRQFDASFAEGQRQFDLGLGEKQRQFDITSAQTVVKELFDTAPQTAVETLAAMSDQGVFDSQPQFKAWVEKEIQDYGTNVGSKKYKREYINGSKNLQSAVTNERQIKTVDERGYPAMNSVAQLINALIPL